ncbi:MAG: diguanylate cyclase [Blautia sp.]
MKDRKCILIVDDMEVNRAILCEQFKQDYQIVEAANGVEAWEYLKKNHQVVAAVLLDLVMPKMGGFEVLNLMKEEGMLKKIPVFLITADDSVENTDRGYEMGVMDIIGKPIVPKFVRRRVSNVVELYRTREQLGQVVERQEEDLFQKSQEIQELNMSIIETLSTAIEFRDCESGQHVQRIHDITLVFLRYLNGLGREEYHFSQEQMEQIATAAIMHDVGKIAIPDYILNKPGRLTKEEFEVMKTHTIQGCELLNRIPKSKENPIYQYAYDICRHHHERYDGRGYPDGLTGDEITIWAQVVSVADVYDALVSKRVYKGPYGHDIAVRMILEGECGNFNPVLMKCLVEAGDELNYVEEARRDVSCTYPAAHPAPQQSTDYKEFVDQISGGMFRYGADEKEVLDYLSPGLLELFGYTEEELREKTGNVFSGLVHPDDLDRVQQEIHSQIKSSEHDRVTYRIIRKDGEIRWVEDRGHLVTDGQGRRWFYVVLIDITEQIQYQQELEEGNARQQVLASLSNDIFFDIDCRSGRIDVFGNFEERFGREPRFEDFVMFQRCGDKCLLREKKPVIRCHPIDQLLCGQSERDLALLDQNGKPVWCRYQSAVLKDKDQKAYHHIGRLLDIHELLMQDQKYKKRAQSDSLTGLYNRRTAVERIEKELSMSQEGQECILLILDVDNFKGINDHYGHPEGDNVLRHLGQVLVNTFRENDVVARLGGDEFLIFMPNVIFSPRMEQRLNELCSSAFENYNGDCIQQRRLTFSMGGVCTAAKEKTFPFLYRMADEALYEAKSRGKNNVYILWDRGEDA